MSPGMRLDDDYNFMNVRRGAERDEGWNEQLKRIYPWLRPPTLKHKGDFRDTRV
jgi:hypothetical protein